MTIIIPTLTGGLGNRIFQVIAALGLAEKINGTVKFHYNLCKENPHDYKFNIFSLFPSIPILQRSEFIKADLIFTEQSSWEEAKEKKVIFMRGHFQDEKWFPKSEIPIVLPKPLYDYSEYLLLHIRRGDYLTLKHHYVPLENYYRKAINMFDSKTKFMIFSDDMEWCKRELPILYPNTLLHFAPTELSDKDTLALMASCTEGAICANSSFSWLGAFFGAYQKNKPCYFPNTWFSDGRETNIFPSWGKIILVNS